MVASTTRKQLEQSLSDVDFPANKADLLQAARDAGDDDTLSALKAIPPETYNNLDQILASVTIDQQAHDGDKAAARRSHTKPGLAETAKDIESRSPIVDELGENRGS
ncbi:hypothetical protein A5764_13870 [Mycobacterium sp. 852002-51057_SCH5723018]|nr:hypothetical protein A5764_13870 [Mycobacterium sp. 852002-51057_SCH5723018]